MREARDVPDTLAEAKFDPSRPGSAEEKHRSLSTTSSSGGSAKLCVTCHVQDEIVGWRLEPLNVTTVQLAVIFTHAFYVCSSIQQHCDTCGNENRAKLLWLETA